MLTISVVIPTYNRAHTLLRAIKSVVSQTLKPAEIIVVDDGSTDNTRELVAAHFPDVLYCYQDNLGVSAARNKGIKLASGEWIAFLDSDDEWLSEKLQVQKELWSRDSDCRLVHSDEIWVRDGVRVNKPKRYQTRQGRIYQYCLPLCAIAPSSVVIEKNLLLEVGCFDETLAVCEDYDLWLKVCASYSVLAALKPLLIKYGGHTDQLSTATWGLDQFRAQALYNMMNSHRFASALTVDEQAQTVSVLRQKLDILLVGATKRGNLELVQRATHILNDLNSSENGCG